MLEISVFNKGFETKCELNDLSGQRFSTGHASKHRSWSGWSGWRRVRRSILIVQAKLRKSVFALFIRHSSVSEGE